MYLDPGFGSMIIQAIISAIAVAGGFFFIAKTKLKKFFRGNKEVPDDENIDDITKENDGE